MFDHPSNFSNHSTSNYSDSVQRERRSRLPQHRWGEPVFFAIILLAGLLVFFIQLCTWAIPQLTFYQEFIASRGTVLETRIAETVLDTTTVFRPEVLLEHQVQGVSYRVWTFDLRTLKPKEGFVADKQLAESALVSFQPGQSIECWYRTDHPEEAVVVWKNSVWGWFFLLLSFSLIVSGLVGFLQSFRLVAVSEERKAARAISVALFHNNSPHFRCPTVPDIRIINESPGTHLAFRLPLGNQPIFPLVGLTLFTFAWFLISFGIMFHSFIYPAENRSDQVIGVVFRGLFCGVGIILFVNVMHRLFLEFRLGPTLLEISDHPLYPGRKYRVLLQQSGILRFNHFSVDLVCEEIARFRQGTDTVTNRKDVFRQTIFSRNDFETTPDLPLRQEFFFQLPIDAMHSFRGENNEILWKIDFHAQMVGKPEIRRECPMVVRPVVLNDLTLEGGGL
ncbi:MAG: DUF3592 domain-containing protein [Planctomycetaceae bacterium]|nr:DUF3592 domain-containing protein [Planctomycetaceae bacterium]